MVREENGYSWENFCGTEHARILILPFNKAIWSNFKLFTGKDSQLSE